MTMTQTINLPPTVARLIGACHAWRPQDTIRLTHDETSKVFTSDFDRHAFAGDPVWKVETSAPLYHAVCAYFSKGGVPVWDCGEQEVPSGCRPSYWD